MRERDREREEGERGWVTSERRVGETRREECNENKRGFGARWQAVVIEARE